VRYKPKDKLTWNGGWVVGMDGVKVRVWLGITLIFIK